MERKLKRMLREMRDREMNLRFGFSKEFIRNNRELVKDKAESLVWSRFFDIRQSGRETGAGNGRNAGGRVTAGTGSTSKAGGTAGGRRYSMRELEGMTGLELRDVMSEYWYQVFYDLYGGAWKAGEERAQNPEFLAFLGLPYDAEEKEVRKRFRELAKQLHPDAGGTEDKFRELMDMAEQYRNRERHGSRD